MRFADAGGDGFPVIGREGAQVNDFDGDAVAFKSGGGDFGAVNDGAVSDDADLRACFDDPGFTEGDRVVGAGIFGAVVGLAVEMLVLEEHHRVITADGGAQQAGDIHRGGRHHDAQAGAVREDRLAALAVIDGAARKITADGYAKDHGAFELSVGAPAHDAEFIADLHHGGPDVVEELNFGDGLHAARGHADGAADNAGFREGRVEDAVRTVFTLQARSGFENAALPFYVAQIFLAAGVGDVFAEDGDAFVASHFVVQCGSDHFDHGLWATVEFGFGSEGW